MKTNFLLLTVLLVLIFSGCKKHESDQQTFVPPTDTYIKSISVYDTNGVLRMVQGLEYDNMHRLIKMTELDLGTTIDSILKTFVFTYSESIVFMKQTISTGPDYAFTITYYLNPSGLADSSIYVSHASLTDSTYERYSYTYSADNQVATRAVKDGDSVLGTFRYHYSKGNVDYSDAVPSHLNSKILYYYSSDHYNTMGNENAGIGFLGKSCLNPMVKSKFEASNTDWSNFAYEYDQLNRISKVIVNGSPIIPGIDFFSAGLIMTHEVMVYTYY